MKPAKIIKQIDLQIEKITTALDEIHSIVEDLNDDEVFESVEEWIGAIRFCLGEGDSMIDCTNWCDTQEIIELNFENS